MIELDAELCDELDITYWQLNSVESKEEFKITRDEKELLRKILLAKAVKLDDEMLKIHAEGVVVIALPNYKLLFNDVSLTDKTNVINLAKLSAMLKDNQQKKLTWIKIKDLLL